MQFTPYLTFNGQCRDAVEFYAKALGAEITMLSRFADMPTDPNAPSPSNPDHIMHACIEFGGGSLMASDSFDGKTELGYKGISISTSWDTTEAGKTAFDKMADGGLVIMPFEKTFWATGFGVVQDKFGVKWMFNCET